MREDMLKFMDELKKAFILREYQILYPQLTTDFEQKSIDEYRRNNLFRYRVDGLVAGVAHLCGKYYPKNN